MTEYRQDFTDLHYLTDIYPVAVKNKLANFIWSSSKLLKVMSRSSFTFHFINPPEVQSFFSHAGFNTVDVIQPLSFSQKEDTSNVIHFQNPEEHGGDLVWVIHASIKKQR